jgi:5-methylcytosine-specific restriction endonuclease McrA
LESKKYLSGSSNSGNRAEFDILYDEEPSSDKTSSARVLLRDRLGEEEFNGLYNSMPDAISKEDLFSLPKKRRRLIIVKNNLKFLIDMEDQGKEIKCEYCEKPLVVYRTPSEFRYENGATCDHKEPISRGGDIFNYDNLAICCHKCNGDKGSMPYHGWINHINQLKSNKENKQKNGN